jgi:hypothetical protein
MNKIIALPINSNVHYFVKCWNHKAVESSYMISKWNYLKDMGVRKFEELQHDDKAIFDWKRKVFRLSSNILDRISADEWFLKEISTNEPVLIEYHSELEKEIVKKRLYDLVTFREGHHRKMKTLSYLCTPFSLACGILPGPNLPFAYNIFRIYSNIFNNS